MSTFDSIIALEHDRQEIPDEAGLSHLFLAKDILSAPFHVNWALNESSHHPIFAKNILTHGVDPWRVQRSIAYSHGFIVAWRCAHFINVVAD